MAVVIATTLVTTQTGCGTKTPAAKTTIVAGSVTTTVDAAMSAWGEWVRKGNATVEQRIKVRDAYLKYQTAMHLAEKVAVLTLSNPNEQGQYATALATASGASSELVALINIFTNKK